MAVIDEEVEELTQEEEELYSLSDEELEARMKEMRQDSQDTEQSEEVEEEESTEPDEEEEDTPEEPTDEDSEELEDNEESEDPESEEEEGQSEEDVEPKGEEEKESEPEASDKTESLRPVKANGVEIPVKSIDEVYQMASMGANYKKKMADLAPHRRKVDVMVEHGLTEEDLSLLVDLKMGDKDAISKILKDSEIDALDLDVENSNYVPKDYAPSEFDLDVREIVSEISNDPEYSMTKRIVDVEWDDSSRDMVKQNPQIIKALHEDVKDGTYAKVLPEAMRLEMLDVSNGQKPKSKLEYAMIATKAYREQE